ncbi:unnamed protein product [Discosporangium mesarthrocarpum]
MSSEASPSPPDSSLDEATEEGFILASINTLLGRVGISAKPINSFEELRKSASSMFVAIFEAMFQVRQKGVVRKPAHVHNYVHNAQMVIDALAGPILNMDLSHITGDAIVRGDTVAIRNLVDIFMGISEVVLKRQARPNSEIPSKKHGHNHWMGSRRRLKARQGQQQRAQEQQQQAQQQARRPGQAAPTRTRSSKTRSKRPGHPSIRPPPRASREGIGRPRGVRPQAPGEYHAQDAVHPAMEREARDRVGLGGIEEEKGMQGMGGMGGIEQERENSVSSPFLHELLVSPASEGVGQGQGLGAHHMVDSHGELFEESRGEGREGPLREVDLGHPYNMRRQDIIREEEREMKYRLFYQRMLKDRLVALRKRELADARKQRFAYRNAKHLSRVRQIKRDRMQENLPLGRMLYHMRHYNDRQGRLTHLYKKVLTALHRQRKEDDREDAARLKALHLAWQGQADDLENFFNERVELIMEHEQTVGHERAQAMASQERALSNLYRQAEKDYETHLTNQLQRQAMEEVVMERKRVEAQRACSELLGLEDWSCTNKDRFLGVRPNSAFERQLKQVRITADMARVRMNHDNKIRNLNKAYGKSI